MSVFSWNHPPFAFTQTAFCPIATAICPHVAHLVQKRNLMTSSFDETNDFQIRALKGFGLLLVADY